MGYKRADDATPAASRSTSCTIRPGTYFNPQTEIMIVVDDSPEVDHEIFEPDEFEAHGVGARSPRRSPLDEHKRDELVERFQLTYQPGGRSSTTTTSRRARRTSSTPTRRTRSDDVEELDPLEFEDE